MGRPRPDRSIGSRILVATFGVALALDETGHPYLGNLQCDFVGPIRLPEAIR